MAHTPRTFFLKKPRMKGDDIKSWQREVKRIFKQFNIVCPIKDDGFYGPATRSFTADLVEAMGLSVKIQMKDGTTPELRSKLRNDDLTPAQRRNKNSAARKEFRDQLRQQYFNARARRVHKPVTTIITSSWGWVPGVHDGVDVITKPDPIIFAMVKSKVIDVRAAGWWGLGAPADKKQKAKGDGIIQLEVLESVGPFKKGMHICYGHAEKAMVKVGQIVTAGTPIGHAGLASAWHIHLMVNLGEVGKQGRGTIDPRPLLNYAVKNA